MEQNIKEDKKDSKKCDCGCGCGCCKRQYNAAAGGGVYGLGFIAALVYFIQHAASFQMGLLGVLKAIIWPAMLVYKALEILKF